jgi:hypothetical protein
MESLKAEAGADHNDTRNKAIIISEWDADTFHRRVLELGLEGYAVRRESYRVTPEMNPETGQIIHLYTVEMYLVDADRVGL